MNLLPLLMMVITVLSAFNFQDKHLQGELMKQQQIKLYFMALAFLFCSILSLQEWFYTGLLLTVCN